MTTTTDKRKAQRAVHAAVKSGELVRPDVCEQCGACGRQLIGHHRDYSKPLEVTWICRKCLGTIHRGEGDPRYLRERRTEALQIYRQLGTYRATGERMGISWGRAWQLVKEGLRLEMVEATTHTKGTR